MARKFCVSCNSYQNSMFDKCEERCGGDDCRERCGNCRRLFSGELVRGGNDQLARYNSQTFAAGATALAQEANRSGGKVEISSNGLTSSIVYHPPGTYNRR